MVLTNSVHEGSTMITKESLQKAKDSVNEAMLKIKQSYSASPTSKRVFFVVEGKDDIPYYATKADIYIPEDWKLTIVHAQNRKKQSRLTDTWIGHVTKKVGYYFL